MPNRNQSLEGRFYAEHRRVDARVARRNRVEEQEARDYASEKRAERLTEESVRREAWAWRKFQGR